MRHLMKRANCMDPSTIASQNVISFCIILLMTNFNNDKLAECCSPLIIDGVSDPRPSHSLARVLGGNVVIEEPINNENHGSVSKSADLLCTEFNNCRWRNGDGQNLKWYRTKGNVDIYRLQAISGTNIPPRTPFAVAATPTVKAPTDAAQLVSNPIPCQESDGEIRFKYWISPSVQISVCPRIIGSQKFEYCSLPIYNGSPGPAFVKIRGPIQQPFEIVIVADHFIYNDGTYTGGLAMIDDLEYNGQICSSFTDSKELVPGKSSEEKQKGDKESLLGSSEEKLKGKTSRVSSIEETCLLLKCNFSDGICPHYKTTSIWRVAKGPVGNPVTGIRGDASVLPYNISGEYLYVEGLHSNARLESLPFSLPNSVLLKFAYYQASVETKFRIYSKKSNNDDLETIFQSPRADINSRRWFTETKLLSAGNYDKIIFEASDVKVHTYVGLDEITLLTKDGIRLC